MQHSKGYVKYTLQQHLSFQFLLCELKVYLVYVALKREIYDASFNVFSCQFVVKEDGDYTIHNLDPDKLVEWDSVELIVSYCHF